MRYRFAELIFGGACTWRGLFSELYGIFVGKVLLSDCKFSVELKEGWQSFGVFLHLLQLSNVQTPHQARHACFHLSQLLSNLEDSIYKCCLFSMKQFLYSRESIFTI